MSKGSGNGTTRGDRRRLRARLSSERGVACRSGVLQRATDRPYVHMKRSCQAFAVSQPTVVLVCPVMHVFRGVLAGVVY